MSDALVVLGVAVVVASCVGMAVLDDPLDRIHLVTPASSIGTVLVCASVVVRDRLDAAGTAAILTAVVVAGSSPFVSHATARSIAVRRRAAQGQPGPGPGPGGGDGAGTGDGAAGGRRG